MYTPCATFLLFLVFNTTPYITIATTITLYSVISYEHSTIATNMHWTR